MISLKKNSDEEKQAASTKLTIDKNHPSKLVFKTTMTTEPSMVYNNKFQIDLDSNDSRVLTHGFFIWTKKGKPITGELPSGMVECEDAFLGRLVKAIRGEMDENQDVGSEEEISFDDDEESAYEVDSEDSEDAEAREDSENPEDAQPVEDMEESSFD